MSTLTRISINPARRNGRKLLTNPQAMHAAVRASFPPDISDEEARVLWRVDPQDHETVLYLSLIHISEPTRLHKVSRMPSSA